VSSSFIQYDGVWFQSHRNGVTYRIYALTDEQLGSLVHFLEWNPKSQCNQQAERPECPLPILGTDDNLTRVDPEVAIPLHNVFRDRWERKMAWNSYEAYRQSQVSGRARPKDAIDYPEVEKEFEMMRQKYSDRGPRVTLGDIKKRRQNGEGSGRQSGA